MNFIPEEEWSDAFEQCEAGFPRSELTTIFIQMVVELYVGVDTQRFTDEDGGTNDEEVNSFSGTFVDTVIGENTTQDADTVRERRIQTANTDWRELTDKQEDPCILITLSRAQLAIGLFGNINFAKGVGGYCFFEPEDNGSGSSTQCTPNGYFVNLEQKIEFKDKFLGLLGTVLDLTAEEAPSTADGSEFSFGLFLDQDKNFEALVFRLRHQDLTFFGVSAPDQSAGGPVIHMQVISFFLCGTF